MRRRLQPSRNVDYLTGQLKTIWQDIPQHTIRNIYQSITHRVADSIEASKFHAEVESGRLAIDLKLRWVSPSRLAVRILCLRNAGQMKRR
ncbi:hypothetical protein LAZ67_5002983 [Cordylochernes scorpioides]|uniref:Uncharacterized protein n=1 Tax=Cordylochernes scorpioides TaxID=51811 RepID=A0ABY6KGV6_9ARAC|nr:hypothetical protein LAZ67_5002983 [Cordylochernes scorpioides]